jgi:hypothetical protein
MHHNIKHTLISYVVLILLFIYGSYQTLSVETISYTVGISLKYQKQIVHPYLFLRNQKVLFELITYLGNYSFLLYFSFQDLFLIN